ncbi:UbiH/UbiF family hydroxylase [Chitinibacter sp. GC72]|uniref:UbiH/UbiF family hydroxylase n=1 Tax=Chitinibacter sp. GC72 TaxID=1526917 RepID=UPI0012F7B377|nr:UbiH/UbiF family hydroxylase [Chitinibacter sp. GC72]
MKSYDADLIIVGGGLVGAALALALKNTTLDMILLEGREPQLDWPLASWDQRVYAISRASRRLLTNIGAWPLTRPERLCPVSAMRIAGDQPHSRLEFAALESGVDELAFIVENRELQRALWLALAQCSNVRVITGVSAQGLEINADAAQLSLDNGSTLKSKLLIGADGANSWVRQQLDMPSRAKSYEQFGVVANFACEKPHYGVAQQWFMPDGILAWLPLPDQQMSMVWSCDQDRRGELLGLSADELAQRVSLAGQSRLGELKLITPAAAFPLKLTHVPEIARSRVVLVGDAAHTVHPLAGQGVNLGFGDVAELAKVLASVHPARIGDALVLRRYERARRESVLLMQTVCDGLQSLFNNHNPILKSLRNIGLSMTDSVPWIKRQLIRHAMDS